MTDSDDIAGTTVSGKAGTGKSASAADSGQGGERLGNPLGDYASYTYGITLYMLGSQAYGRYVRGDDGAVNDAAVVARSGGINSESQQRSPNIPYDLYIDNLSIKTITATKENSIPSNSYDFTFQIFEPYGFSFPTQLVKTAMQFQTGNPNTKDTITALAQHYLLEIKFYGFDIEGNPIAEAQGVYSRKFPIMIRKMTFKLDNKVSIYNINAVLVNEQIGMGVRRGTVPPNLNLKADTVINAIKGEEQSTGKPSQIRGLFQAINEEQEKAKKAGQLEFPDKYEVEFTDSSMGESEIVGEWYLKTKSPLTATTNTAGSNPKTAATQNSKKVDKEIRTISIQSGSSIVSAIDQILSQSKYIEEAVTERPREEVQSIQKTKVKVDKEEGKTISWYNITPHVTPGQWDKKRNDYQYTIKYVIQPYEIPYVRSLYIKKAPQYPGPHKRYDYWYTGKNTEILSYEQDYNLLYFQAAASMNDVPTKDSPNNNAPVSSQPGQNADPTSKLSGAFEIINSVKTFLYSPGDQIKARLKILGDPDYLMTATGGAVSNITKKRLGEDFSINPNSGQVFIEVDFKEGIDYNTETGLLDINESITFWDYPASLKGKIKGMAYMVISVVSTFNKGLFTQELKTIIPPFKEPSGGEGQGEDTGRESETAAPSVENVEGPALPDSRVPDSSAGPVFDDNSGSFDPAPYKAEAPELAPTVPSRNGTKETAPVLTDPPVVNRQVPAAQGRQVQDDDGSYDRKEMQRLQNRATATPPSAEVERKAAVAATYQKVPKNLKLREAGGTTVSPRSFRVFDPETYKKD
jgi:hypothetical protein